jgi:hypothetical protein
MLHILNGDAMVRRFEAAGIPGERLVWREALIAGPASFMHPKGWIDRRAEHLSRSYGVDPAGCRRDLEAQELRLLEASEREDEIVLWFEADLFCQVHLMYILFRLDGGGRLPNRPRVSMVSAAAVTDDVYTGFGRLSPEDLRAMFEARDTLWLAPMRLGSMMWLAYASQFPVRVEKLLTEDIGGLPYLRPALRAHLERFPSVRNGLGRIQNRVLDLVASGTTRFPDLFNAFAACEPVYGLGDFQLWNEILELLLAPYPFLTSPGLADPTNAIRRGDFAGAELRITSLGAAVLNGKEDAIGINGVDCWLGGVHLRGGFPLWRWDEAKGELVAAGTA